ncbi:cobyrinate a,c-diamide synthase [Alkalilimnicola sp. S0819]|uniref:cobyrinate a,c-diamide synthase n=1 Tax=Alkalilimnicola sp. S0819 TaxID=2613922 RepID=UPI0012622E18|nr:cobyrinate a,c-diamide synthase [Alkalilimnicola sp. S0819]KAB7623382.1 cobyrinate a,c-diamide synthase [Alkalilimnicola sp. S0819]MPQ16924.1 cobyrinate a,c-diamide synthase [Alkalilimnicola sp. S0819]
MSHAPIDTAAPDNRHCPAVLIAAPGSGQGKTILTAALARLHRRQGRRVRVFKIGPDFIDPMIHQRASGERVDNLDLWMVGAEESRRLLHQAAGEADLILLESAMGLYDGSPSGADLASLLGVPVLLVIDAAGMAQTFGAVAQGLASHQPGLPFAGVVANRVGSPYHGELLGESLPTGMRFFGAVPRHETLTLPERHLGLVQAQELDALDQRLDEAAGLLLEAGLDSLPEPVSFAPAEQHAPAPLLAGVRIAIARDAAFSFIYEANLDLLRALGAELSFFSPLHDRALPEADALWLPGGYPELHLQALAANAPMKAALQAHQQAGKPLYAECGGMLYLLERLSDREGHSAEMAGLLPGSASLQPKLAALGLQALALPEGELRGHAFHYSRTETSLEPWRRGQRQRRAQLPGEAVYRRGRTIASYLHLYFPSSPAAAAALFRP